VKKGATPIKEKSWVIASRNVLIKIFNVFYRILLEYSKYVLLAIVLIVSADVISRNVFKYSILWVQETSLLLIVWMTFLSMALGSEKDLHIGIEIFYKLLPASVQKVVQTLNRIIIIVIGIFLGIYGWRLSMSTWKSTLAVTKLPAGMLYLMIPAGGWTMSFFMILDLLGFKEYKKTDYDEEEIPPVKDMEEFIEKLSSHQIPAQSNDSETTTENPL